MYLQTKLYGLILFVNKLLDKMIEMYDNKTQRIINSYYFGVEAVNKLLTRMEADFNKDILNLAAMRDQIEINKKGRK